MNTTIIFLCVIAIITTHLFIKNNIKKSISNATDGIDELYRFKLAWLSLIEKKNTKTTIVFIILLKLFLLVLSYFIKLDINSYFSILFGAVSTFLIFKYTSYIVTILQKRLTKNLVKNPNIYYQDLIIKAILSCLFFLLCWLISHKLFYFAIQAGLDYNLFHLEKNQLLFDKFYNKINQSNSSSIEFFNYYYYLESKIFYLFGIIFTAFFTITAEIIYAKSAHVANQIISHLKYHLEENSLLNPSSIFKFVSTTTAAIKTMSILVIIYCFTLSSIHVKIENNIILHWETNLSYNIQHIHLLLFFAPIIILSIIYLLFKNKLNINKILSISTTIVLMTILIILFILSILNYLPKNTIFVIGLGAFQATLILLLTQHQLKAPSKTLTNTENDFDNNIISGLISSIPHSLIPTLIMLTINTAGFIVSYNMFYDNAHFINGLYGIIVNLLGFLPFIILCLIFYIMNCFEKNTQTILDLLDLSETKQLIQTNINYTSDFFLKNNFLIINIIICLGLICLFIYKLVNNIFLFENLNLNIEQSYYNSLFNDLYTQNTITHIAEVLKISIFSEEFIVGLLSGGIIFLLVVILSLRICKKTINVVLTETDKMLQISTKEEQQLDFNKLFSKTIKETNKSLFTLLVVAIILPISILFFIGSAGVIGIILSYALSLLSVGLILSNTGILWEKNKLLTFDKNKNDTLKANSIIGDSLSLILKDTLIPILLLFSLMLYLILYEGTPIALLSDLIIWKH